MINIAAWKVYDGVIYYRTLSSYIKLTNKNQMSEEARFKGEPIIKGLPLSILALGFSFREIKIGIEGVGFRKLAKN